MRRLLCAAVVALVTFGLASPAWAQGGPPVHTEQVTTDTSSNPSENPCTGDPGIVTFNERYVAKITTFRGRERDYNVHGSGTFDFDATDPAAADFFAVPEHPTNNIQFKADANGNGTFSRSPAMTRGAPTDHESWSMGSSTSRSSASAVHAQRSTTGSSTASSSSVSRYVTKTTGRLPLRAARPSDQPA